MKVYFTAISFALLFAAFAGGAMLWDGNYYLYCALNSGNPCVSNNRWITLFLHFPVLLAARFSVDIPTLQLIFGLTYALVPISVLLISWWIVRDSARHLFLWAAFGLGYGTVLLQLHFVAEAVIAVQLAWPIFLAQLISAHRKSNLAVVTLALFLFISHPFAIGLFALIGVATFIVGWQVPRLRAEKWSWAAAWWGIAAVSFVRFYFSSSAYEVERLSLAVWTEGLQAVRGVPGIALLSATLTAGIVFYVSRRYSTDPQTQPGWVNGLWIALILLTTGLLVVWGNDPVAWNSSFGYRILVPIVSLPFFIFAGLEGVYALAHAPPIVWRMERGRLWMIQAVGISFAIVLGVQAWSWYGLQRQLVTLIANSPTPCLSLADVSSTFGEGQRPFHHWSISTLSLFLQGTVPAKIIVEQPCEQVDFSVGLPVNGWEVQAWGTNQQFDLRHLEEALRPSGSASSSAVGG